MSELGRICDDCLMKLYAGLMPADKAVLKAVGEHPRLTKAQLQKLTGIGTHGVRHAVDRLQAVRFLSGDKYFILSINARRVAQLLQKRGGQNE